MIPRFNLIPFNIAEFEMMFNGLNKIDVKDWEFNTIYMGNYYKDHKIIKQFWEILNTYD